MAEPITVASLTISVDDVVKESVRLRKEMDKVKDTQKSLDKSTEEGAAAYEKSAAELKNLSKAYKDNQQFAAALDSTNEDLNKTMKVQGKSTQELYDSRRELNVIAKNIKGDTEEEIKLREKLNASIDEQTEAIKKQAPGYIEQKENIGAYTEGINASDLSLQNVIKSSQEQGGASKLLKNGFKSAASGMKAFTKASLAFILTPVGLVLAAIAGAFLLIKNAMNRSEDSTNKIRKAFAGFSGIVKGLFKVLEPLGKFLIDGIAGAFALVENAIAATMKGIQKALDFLGFDKAAASMDNFNKNIAESAQLSRELVTAELELAKAQRFAQKVQLDYQKQAEKLRQIRDDESKSTKERIAANEELGNVLKKQLEEELAIAEKALEVANLRIKLEGETTETLDEQAAALTEISDIQERITGQESEQLVNRVSLQKEAADKIREIEDAKAEASEESARRKMEADKEAALAAIEWAKFELSEYIRANKSKLESDKFLTDAATNEEIRRLEALAEKRREFEALKLEEGQLNQLEYNEAIAVINEENQIKIDEANLARKEAEAEQRAIDAENELIFIEEQGYREYEALLMRLERDRQAELDAADKTGADRSKIDAKYDQRKKQLDADVVNSQIDGFGQVLSSYASALGEQSKAGKAAAIAATLISTYQSAVSAFNSLANIPVVGTVLGIAAAGLAVASGLKQVSKIRSTPTKYSKGEILKGNSHARNGIPFTINGQAGFEAEGGEAIINKRSTSMFAPLLSSINAAGGGKKFASGGITGISSGLNTSSLVDYDLLAAKMAQANENLPNPVVSVAEINEVSENVAVIEDLASA